MTILKLDGSVERFIESTVDMAEASYADAPEWQKCMEIGDRFIRLEAEFCIYGVLEDPLGWWKQQEPLNEEEREEFNQELLMMTANRDRGFMFGRCYSIVCPEGELGDTHCSRVHGLVTEEQFDEARARGWPDLSATQRKVPLSAEGYVTGWEWGVAGCRGL